MTSEIDYELSNGRDVEDICTSCRAGWHSTCGYLFDGKPLLGEDFCCCGGAYSPMQHTIAILKAELGAREQAGLPEDAGDTPAPGPTKGQPTKGDSGYIHPDAWRSTKNLGDLTDPQSTGRKRAKDMYPIPQGLMCEWAGLAAAGGGVFPITGCIGYAAQDIHHGPDKNTLNNAKASMGVGDQENVHRICSFCHNAWHAANDPHYPSAGHDDSAKERWYERDQATPFLPRYDAELEIHVHDAETRTDNPRVYDTSQKGRVGKDGVREEWEDDDDD